jgi:glycolate oxidase FAD binding subunit
LSGASSRPEPLEDGALGDGRLALATFRPGEVDALCMIVREQVALGRAIYPQGGRTTLEYGGIPSRPGVALDTTSLCRLIDYPSADMTITIQAGMTLSALRAILAEEHQRVLVDAPYPERATLGGIYATNASGPRRFGAGRPRDQIIGVSFVTSEGVVVKGGGRVVKNVAGYDFPKLITGSMGTLGIITQLTLKLRPIPEASMIVWAAFPDRTAVDGALTRLNTSGTRPIAIEALNGSAAAFVGQGLDLPTNDTVLALGFEDNARSVRWQVERVKDELGQSEIVVVAGETCAALWNALTEFQAHASGPISLVANIRPSSNMAFLDRLDPATWSAQSHAGNGIVRAHALGEWTLDEASREIELLRKLAVQDGGNLILPHCPTEWKTKLRVWGEPRPDWSIAQRIKVALDPHNAFNPGRFLDLGS